jgi:Uma2 family endonuclease
MNVLARPPMSLQQFLAWEKRQELRYEFDGLRPIAMNGGTIAHAAIQINLLTALHTRLKGKPCRAFGDTLKIEVAGRIRYPDAFVICTPVIQTAHVVSDPVIIFEILSKTTEKQDLVVKNAEYRETSSVKRYIILQQTLAGAQIFVRRGDEWISELESGLDKTLKLSEIGIEIPMSEIYADVELSPDPLDDEP